MKYHDTPKILPSINYNKKIYCDMIKFYIYHDIVILLFHFLVMISALATYML